jgi:hypothetical protein
MAASIYLQAKALAPSQQIDSTTPRVTNHTPTAKQRKPRKKKTTLMTAPEHHNSMHDLRHTIS